MEPSSEAGPSKPRKTQQPTTPKPRRKSWFHFGSSATSSNTAPPIPPLPQSRSGSLPDDEVELDNIGSTQTAMDETLGRSAGLAPNSMEEELLTIDGDLEKTVKKKKKRRSKGGEDEGETMRMMDLNSGRRPSTASGTSNYTVVAAPIDSSTTPFPARTFSRTASDRYPEVIPTAGESSHGQSSVPTTLPLHMITPRSSSIQKPAFGQRVPSDASNKEQPPIPVDVDRPLPPLPPPKPRPTIPSLPAGIVVTPSSPIKAFNDEAANQGIAETLAPSSRRSRSGSRSHSAESLRTHRAASTGTNAIGLGLPPAPSPSLTATVPVNDRSRTSKPQSVSSPVPSRKGSPVPRISFADPGELEEQRGREPQQQRETKQGKVKRARSLSGIFNRSPVNSAVDAVRAQTSNNPGDDSDEPGGTSRSQGVLEWLGVRRPVARRQSEAQLHEAARDDQDPKGSRSASPFEARPQSRGQTYSAKTSREGSRVELLADNEEVEEAERSSTLRPQMRSSTSNATVTPASVSKLSNLFSRKSSSKHSDIVESGSNSSNPSQTLGSYPDQGLVHRNSAAASSQSSFTLPPIDTVSSPIPLSSGPWATSPERDDEELLWSSGVGSHWGPGIRPWMDGTEAQRPLQSSPSSPLGPVPEQRPSVPPVPPSSQRDRNGSSNEGGRARAWSDAPHPSETKGRTEPTQSRVEPLLKGGQNLPKPAPVTPTRPSMTSRANSGNSAIIDRMKTVFARGSSRQRSNTTVTRDSTSSEADEFGGWKRSNEWTSRSSLRPGSSTSSSMTSPNHYSSRSPVDESSASIFLDPTTHDHQHFDVTGTGTSRAATTIPQPAQPNGRLSIPTDSRKDLPIPARTRQRASTISTGPTTQVFAPPSPSLFPIAGTPPRRRPSAIRRISNNLLGSRPSSPKPPSGSLFPLPPRSTGSLSSTGQPGSPSDDSPSGLNSISTSPRPSMGSIAAAVNTSQSASKRLRPNMEEETPSQWVEKVSSAIGRGELSSVLAASGDAFHIEALRIYLSRFDFRDKPLDIALRQLLMHLSLPRETQQIDRLIEAFATRYEECEPGLFGQKDDTYVLGFSMMMLHTDAFNRNNRNKMTKADYVKNTRMDGVPSVVLEVFYDNITFTPFVFIEDDADLLVGAIIQSVMPTSLTPNTTPMGPPKTSKLDVYHLIVNDNLASLRVNVGRLIPMDNPFSCLGTRPFVAVERLHRTFAQAPSVRVVIPGTRRKSSAAALQGKISSTPTRGAPSVEVTLKVAKVGVLSRRNDAGEGNRKSKKWKLGGFMFTGSQIILLKDPATATGLLEQLRELSTNPNTAGEPPIPRLVGFKPDEVYSLDDCVAIFDQGLGDDANAFRLILPQGRQYIVQAADEFEMNEWITLINYASTYMTAGIRMRGSTINKEQVILVGTAAAASHQKDLQIANDSDSELPTPHRDQSLGDTAVSTPMSIPSSRRYQEQEGTLSAKTSSAVNGSDDAVISEGDQLDHVFDVVKAELAAGSFGAAKKLASAASFDDAGATQPKQPVLPASRTTEIESRLKYLHSRLLALRKQLEATMRIVRNLAILTPFQRSTRDRISSTLPALALRVQSERLEIAKFEFWVLVLQQDLGKERKEWDKVKQVALQAATRILQPSQSPAVNDVVSHDKPVSRLGVSIDAAHGRAYNGEYELKPTSVPLATGHLPSSLGEIPGLSSRPSDEAIRPLDLSHPVSGTATSSRRPSGSLESRALVNGPTETVHGNQTPLMFPLSDTENEGPDDGNGVASSSGITLRQRHQDQEEAEDWQKTRAAKRVSLANVPDGDELRKLDRKLRNESSLQDMGT